MADDHPEELCVIQGFRNGPPKKLLRATWQQARAGGGSSALLGELFYGRAVGRLFFEPWGLVVARPTQRLRSMLISYASAVNGPCGQECSDLLLESTAHFMGAEAMIWSWYR